MSLRRPNDLISDEEGLSSSDRVCIGFILIGAVVGLLLTDLAGLLFGAGAGYLGFQLMVSILTSISSFLSRRRR
ncbi:hypothetical protein M0Q28_04235 [Patescibacteria group bacterium]|jgi:hypothetical protein|nr:hypothetical protein [Patescibacteria group bacterium]